MSTAITFEHVSKCFSGAGYPAVDNVTLSVNEGELVTIVGTSGCGKTTLLKMVNRIQEPDDGKITLFGQDIMTQDPVLLRRKIGYVIQQVGLFPHMTVFHNIAAVPKILKWKKQEIQQRVDELCELVNLPAEEFRDRYPSQLSGGQQQRVGLARALAANPSVMLLDEPFGAIDAINRVNLQDELLHIHKTFKKTMLFVTHDIQEAFKLGSRVLIMDQGRIEQFDTPQAIMAHPETEFVRSLIASSGMAESVLQQGEGI